MNCRRVQDLLSPYLDERLTGQQMLEVRRHLDSCRSCSEEYMMLRQVKILLRSVSMKEPGPFFEARLRAQIEAERQAATIPISLPAFNLNHRSRRLAYAMALSCVSILSLAHATSTKMAMTDAPVRPILLDAHMPNAILTDLEGESITTAFRVPANPPVQNPFYSHPHPEFFHQRRAYDFVGSFAQPVNVYSNSAVTLAGYPTH